MCLFLIRGEADTRTLRHVADTSNQLWEEHADWWIEGFTDGADPEYEEQILPLAAHELAGARRVLDIGCGDGRLVSAAATQFGCRGIGVERDGDLVELARELVRSGGVDDLVTIEHGDARSVDLSDVTVALVFEFVLFVLPALGEGATGGVVAWAFDVVAAVGASAVPCGAGAPSSR